ncbi:MAG TPA: class I SAM-dependent methyltransferase [Spirochaetota bacterium]|nr:class I SAM-dependent methyltransferase [Spirochaetota bacterium]
MWTEGGSFYSWCIDPLLSGIREAMRMMIDPPGSVIDIACGTGAFVFLIADMVPRVVGVELLPQLVSFSENMNRRKFRRSNVRFAHCDASSMPEIDDGEFDYATISMALHQMEEQAREAVLSEAKRISKHIILADYAVPLPNGIAGISARTVEFLAGCDHFRGFRSFVRGGGLDFLMARHRLVPEREESAGAGIFRIVRCAPHR